MEKDNQPIVVLVKNQLLRRCQRPNTILISIKKKDLRLDMLKENVDTVRTGILNCSTNWCSFNIGKNYTK